MNATARWLVLVSCVSVGSLAAAQEVSPESREARPSVGAPESSDGVGPGAPLRQDAEADDAMVREPPPSVVSETPATPSFEGEREAEPRSARRPLLILFLSLIGIGLGLFLIDRVRAWLSANGPLRRFLGGLAVILRLGGLAVIVGIAVKLLPTGQDWILWGLAILVIVTGWSVRDLFADIVAGAVLAGERRVRKGMWVSGNGFQGTVEGRSLRATWLRDGQGHRLTVPNRAMVAAPMVYDSGAEAEHEVVVRLEGYDDASRIRLALQDAILSSPWVLAGATPVVLRDPSDPVVWRVRSKLLEPRFSVHFEGELLERVEDLLRYSPSEQVRDTMIDEEVTEEVS